MKYEVLKGVTVTIILAEAAEVTDVLKENSTLIREWKPMSDNATDLVAADILA